MLCNFLDQFLGKLRKRFDFGVLGFLSLWLKLPNSVTLRLYLIRVKVAVVSMTLAIFKLCNFQAFSIQFDYQFHLI